MYCTALHCTVAYVLYCTVACFLCVSVLMYTNGLHLGTQLLPAGHGISLGLLENAQYTTGALIGLAWALVCMGKIRIGMQWHCALLLHWGVSTCVSVSVSVSALSGMHTRLETSPWSYVSCSIERCRLNAAPYHVRPSANIPMHECCGQPP